MVELKEKIIVPSKMKQMNYYPKEDYPENIIYIRDTAANRITLSEKLGEPMMLGEEFCYLIINTTDKTWHSSHPFEWLYRDAPPLTPIDVIKKCF